MRTAVAALLMAAASLYHVTARAQETQGSVRAIYWEAAPGVLVGAGMLHRRGAARWLDVELDDVRPEAHARVLVFSPDGMEPSVGDRVALRLGEPKSTQLAAILPPVTVNRALAVVPGLAETASAGASKPGK